MKCNYNDKYILKLKSPKVSYAEVQNYSVGLQLTQFDKNSDGSWR